jgi:type I restriction enzyme S subunit
MSTDAVSVTAAVEAAWKQHRLGEPEVSEVVMGQSPPSETYNRDGVGLPFFQGKVDFGSRNPSVRLWCSAPAKIAQPGDVLLSVRAPVGDVNMAAERCCIGRGLAAVRAGALSDPEFLFYLLLHHKPDLDGLGSGAIFKAVNRETLRSFQVLLPAVDEQRAIAGVLSTLQTAVEVQNRIVATLKELKAATMARLFREGLRGEPLRETEIGEIPASWRVLRLVDIVKLSSGRARPQHLTADKTAATPFPVWGGNGVMGYSDEFLTSREVLVIGRVGAYCGAVHLAPPRSWITDNALYNPEPPRENADLRFLSEYLSYRKLNQLRRTGAQPLITQGTLEPLPIPFPEEQEQQEIGRAARLLQASIGFASQVLAARQVLFVACLQDLVSGAVRVTQSLEAPKHA